MAACASSWRCPRRCATACSPRSPCTRCAGSPTDLRAHARAVAALSSRAQDRRPDPRPRARPQRHRDHRAHRRSCSSSPTIVELALIVGALLYQFDWRYVVVDHRHGRRLYLVTPISATDWRIGIRRQMNDSDTDANTKAIDSLLNYETVKYFGAEEREAARYDRSMARYEDASVQGLCVARGAQCRPGGRSSPSGSPPSW